VHQSLDGVNVEDEEYNTDLDLRIQEAHKMVMDELKGLETTKKWAPGKIFQLYMMSDKTLEEVAGDIGISKSTVFLSVKKIRMHLKETIQNPFQYE
jgi:DNA-directed RNA polymerase specialized sigma subunit